MQFRRSRPIQLGDVVGDPQRHQLTFPIQVSIVEEKPWTTCRGRALYRHPDELSI
jgi:hypothetical protein